MAKETDPMRGVRKRVVQIALEVLIQAGLLFALSGRKAHPACLHRKTCRGLVPAVLHDWQSSEDCQS